MQRVTEQNHEVSQFVNNPNLMCQTMEMIRIPTTIQEITINHDTALVNLESLPSGYNIKMNEATTLSTICIACTHKSTDKPGDSIELQFDKKLKDSADSIRTGMKVPRVFRSLSGNVKQSALSISHLCLLFEDGTVCRIAFTTDELIDKELEHNLPESVRPPSVKRCSRVVPLRNQQQANSRANTLRANLDRLAFNAAISGTTQPADLLPQIAAAAGGNYSISRSRLVRGNGRSRRGAAMLLGSAGSSNSGYPVVPAQNVPEELIEEAQAVLQGKSRNTIIRELQRTNLDINVAVNNLLGRDEDMEEGQEEDQYAQDFVSFMDMSGIDATGADLHPSVLLEAADLNSDEAACLSLRCDSLSRRVASIRGEMNSDRRNAQGWPISQQQIFGNDEPTKAGKKAEQIQTSCPLRFSSEVEWCKYQNSDELGRFLYIAALHTELLLVSANEECLVQWRFDSKVAYTDPKNNLIHHPRAESLGLAHERVSWLHACVSRAVVTTVDTGKICSFVDESLGSFAARKLDFPATHFSTSKPISAYTSCYFTIVLCENNRIFWWGALPKKSRVKVMDRAKDKSKQTTGSDDSEISINSKVVLQAVRFIQIGAVGFTVKDGIPKIGQLLDTVISTDSTYRFLVRKDIYRSEDILDIAELNRYEERHVQAPTGSKRKRSTVGDDAAFHTSLVKEHRSDLNSHEWYEENWHIADVIFIEESKVTPLGTVLMIDKSHLLVKLSSVNESKESTSDCESTEVLSNTRIFRKDDLRVFDEHRTSFLPNLLVKYPKRVAVDFGNPLALCVDNEVLHCVSVNMNCVAYLMVDVASSKIIKFIDFPFGINQNAVNLQSFAMSLSVPYTNLPVIMKDLNSCIFPLKRTFTDTLQEVEWKNLMPLSSFASVVTPLKVDDPFSASGYRLITFATVCNLKIMPMILRCEFEKLVDFIYPNNAKQTTADKYPISIKDALGERCDGDRNILHVAVSMCFPTSNKLIAPKEGSKNNKDEKNVQESNMWTDVSDLKKSYAAPKSSSDSDNQEYLWSPVKYNSEDIVARTGAILKCMLESDFFSAGMDSLLTHRNLDGHTPFMYAINGRAYSAALDIFDKILDISQSRDDKGEFTRKAIFPISTSTNPDDCPLYVLCCNDNCSYTWTGDEHINQSVFKCYTCNIQGSRCCCTECARVCHKNHDCRLKVVSPTAYCDCWEVCKCKALISGDQKARALLFSRLLKETDLIVHRNSRGEPLPLFLVQTAARQMYEQRHYKGNNRTLLRVRRSVPNSTGLMVSNVPDSLFTYAQMLRRNVPRNDNGISDKQLTPPSFCLEVLEQTLSDYNALRSVFCVNDCSITDKFVLTLLTRLPETIINQFMIQLDGTFDGFIQSFVESVARVTLYISMITSVDARCNLPIGILSNFHTRVSLDMRTKLKPLTPLHDKAREIFCMYPMKSIETLVDIAERLIAPVKSGIVGPESSIVLYNDIKLAIQALDDALSPSSDRQNRFGVLSGFIPMTRLNEEALPREEFSDQFDDDYDDTSTISFHDDDDDDTDEDDDTVVVVCGQEDDNQDHSEDDDEDDDGDDDDDEDEEEEDEEDHITAEEDDATQNDADEDEEDDDEAEAIMQQSCGSSDEDDNHEEASHPNPQDTVAGSNTVGSLPTSNNLNTNSSTQPPSRTDEGVTFTSLNNQNERSATTNHTSSDPNQVVAFSADSINSRSALCRGYAVAIRLISFIIGGTGDSDAIETFLEERLADTWSWLSILMNATELSLRQGIWLGSVRSRKPNNIHPLRSSFLKMVIEDSKRMKQQPPTEAASQPPQQQPSSTSSSHDSVRQLLSPPYFNLSSCNYLAYVLDAMLGLQLTLDKIERNLPFNLPWKCRQNIDTPSRSRINKYDRFFHRTESTLAIGLEVPDVITTPLSEALPLVSRPQLLQPDSYKEEIWFNGQPANAEEMLSSILRSNESTKTTHYRIFNTNFKSMPLGDRSFLTKWRLSIDAFTKLFIDDIGQELLSILPCFANFQHVEAKFRQEAERLRNTATKEIRFENVERSRISLIYKLFRSLNVAYLKATSTNSNSSSYPLLAFSKIRVSFKDEPGEGVGVTRSFYTSVIHELLADEPLPPLESCQALMPSNTRSRERRLSISPLVSRSGSLRNRPDEPLRSRRSLPSLIDSARHTWTSIMSGEQAVNSDVRSTVQQTDGGQAASTISDTTSFRASSNPQFSRMLAFNTNTNDDETDSKATDTTVHCSTDKSSKLSDKKDDCPLFWKPQADKEFFAPRPAPATPNRLNAYRNVGRLIGLCLLNNDILPIFLCRHVIKYILRRDISWHDLAFFDSTVYESMRRLLHQVESNPEKDISDIGLRWAIDLRAEEGSGTSELIDNGMNTQVIAANLNSYVKTYTNHRLIKLVEPFLKNLRQGLLDVLPLSSISHLNAEEFRLLLNGSDRIDVKSLYSYTTFIDESGEETSDRLDRFKRWFWTVVEGMSPQKRQDLVLFWTGSPTLPSSAEGFQAAPSITIRHPDDQHLPTANTCISRLYIPLYSTKQILRQKLIYAIKAKNFGFI
ncbi:hypothetical protein GJ496_001098 [Pomphorhynchus laevis]|nr:hypothetical protein GJ496_001098 [Pomphorhynchus laevis]